jgi:tight adherence protein C
MRLLLDLLPAGMEPVDLITLMAGISAFLTVLAVWQGLLARQPGGRRIKEMLAKREQLRAGMLVGAQRRERAGSTGFMRRVVQRLNLHRTRKTEEISLRLARAGWRSNDALVRYLFFKVTLPLACGAAAVLALYVLKLYDLKPMMRLAVTMGLVVLGAFLPDLVISNAATKRKDKLRKALPDVLDLMVICAEAGLSLDSTLKRVSDEFARSSPEMADELGLTCLELGFLPDRRQALHNLNQRTDQPGVRGLVNSLLQTDKYGTPLAQSLRVLSAEYREERMLRAEEKAARLPALLTVPMIVFILPPLFVVLIGPAIIRTIDALSSM